MRFTNHANLPLPFVRAVEATNYPPARWPGVSVTEIIGPIRVALLRRRHWEDLEEDVSDNIWRILGIGVHWVLQHADHPDLNALVEERLTMRRTVAGVDFVLRGRPDLYMDQVISDYKVSGARAYMRGAKREWMWQLNIYARMLEEIGFPVRGLEDVPILRDWQASRARRFPSYPQYPAWVYPIELQAPAVVEAYVKARLEAFAAAYALPDEALPPCTDHERWQDAPRWAVRKRGAKAAVRGGNFGTPEEAAAHVVRLLAAEAAAPAKRKRKGAPTDYDVEERPSLPNRCLKDPFGYCGVRGFCTWWKENGTKCLTKEKETFTTGEGEAA